MRLLGSLFVCLWLVAAAVAAVTPISSSIVLAVPTDYLLDGSGRSTCIDMVERAAQYDVKRLQFVPTLFWVDNGPLDPPANFDPSCKGDDFLAGYYCYNRFNSTTVKFFCYDRDGGNLGSCNSPPTGPEIQRFSDSLAACMKVATARGLDISVNMHIDDATKGGLGGWRNTLNFDPLEQYSGISYVDAVLNPIADAIASAVASDTQAWLTMQGETGATLFFHPDEWRQVAGQLRTRILDGVASRGIGFEGGDVQLGVGINNAKVCGCILVGIVDQREYLAQFPAAFAAVESEFDLPAIQALFTGPEISYVGLSAYIPQANVQFQPCDLEGLMSRLDEELGFYGVILKDLLAAGKEIHWIEFGVGGGTSPRGDQPARTAKEAAFTPFFGISGPYRRATDPFILYQLSRPSPVRDYARYFYNTTAQYLEQGGCEYNCACVHLEPWQLGHAGSVPAQHQQRGQLQGSGDCRYH
ncbi:hypothetical protein D9Q98_004660 [Chlorella vulgaris]|uniref:Uncharacterized protein n=1 Tax=Chlorella vulgaris TaxID=3077 RepID=A0A9D4YX88_CHLVU|nr:hypothetical protein D9Q98_004660 [Chlorella vulgaris]